MTAAHPEFGPIPALTAKSKVLKQVNADDYSARYPALAAFGISVSEDGVLRPGNVVVADAIYTVLPADSLVIVDLLAVTRVVTLPVSGSIPAGKNLWVVLRSSTGGQVTLTAGAGDTIYGGASVAMVGAGAVQRIKIVGTDWVAQ
jgi:hypothetical protein